MHGVGLGTPGGGRRLWRVVPAFSAAVAAAIVGTGVVAPTAASAGLLSGGGLLGGVLCPVTNTLGLTSAGWDDGATRPPTSLGDVEQTIGASQLYSRGITGAGVGVALVDSGVVPVAGLSAPGKVVDGPDLSFESQIAPLDYLDTYGHGTHMAGIIAGNDGSAGPFRGVAPGAHVVSLKVASHNGVDDVSQVLAAIDWVVQHRNDPGMNIRVLNLSFGTHSVQSYQLDPIAFAVENAWRHGIVTVVAGGNDGSSTNTLNDPAVDPYVLAVGAADLNQSTLLGCTTVAAFSSRSSGRTVDLVAPGVSLESLRDPGSAIDQAHPGAVVDGRFFRGSGTSQATAVVSGAVALLLQARPTLTPDQVKALLKGTSSQLTLLGLDSSAEGSGFMNVASAASAAVPWGATQSWARATGAGSIAQARGGAVVSLNGVALTGEQDIMGKPWNGARWAAATAATSAWSGGSWNGAPWAGSCWCGSSWTQPTWAAAWWSTTWTGNQWSGNQWSGNQWSGNQWSGNQWSGNQWSGNQWSGNQWSGNQWSGNQWSSGEWLSSPSG